MGTTLSAPVRMAPSAITRDGLRSCVADELLLDALVPVTVEEALSWAEQIKLDLPATGRAAFINEARATHGLPGFRIIKGMATRPQVARPAAPVQEARVAPHDATRPIAASELDLVDLVTSFTGTRTGLVTGEVAAWLLQLNTHNRPLNKNAVAKFKAVLVESRWVNTGEAVIVSREGMLNDGQHRLTAIRDTGIAAEMDVRFGIPREAFHVTGTGTKRTAANVVAIAGHRLATSQAGIARLLWIYDFQMMAQHNIKVDTDLVLRVVASDPLIGRVAEKIQRLKFAPVRTAPFGMILTAAARHAPFEEVTGFAEIAAGALCQDEDMAPRRHHVRLRDEALSSRRISQLDVAILTARAWNAWTERRPLSRLIVSDADRTSAGFPKVLPMKEARS